MAGTAALADARRLAVARVPRPDDRRRGPDHPAAALRGHARRGSSAALLLAGFANLLLIAVVAPLAGARAAPPPAGPAAPGRRSTTPAPRCSARSTVVLVARGPRAPARGRAEQAGDEAALVAAVRAYVAAHAPEWAPGLGELDARAYAPDVYRVCVPGSDPRRALCLIVDTDRRPARVTRDPSMTPDRTSSSP